MHGMTKEERNMWKINIESYITVAIEKAGIVVVQSVFRRYDAHNFQDLNSCYYTEVFSDFQQILSD